MIRFYFFIFYNINDILKCSLYLFFYITCMERTLLCNFYHTLFELTLSGVGSDWGSLLCPSRTINNTLRTAHPQKYKSGKRMRLRTNFVLFLSLCLSKEEVVVDVLKAYVSLLIRDQQTDLVASYVSQLPAELATAQYAAFLETVNQPELRPRCLQLATNAGETKKFNHVHRGRQENKHYH